MSKKTKHSNKQKRGRGKFPKDVVRFLNPTAAAYEHFRFNPQFQIYGKTWNSKDTFVYEKNKNRPKQLYYIVYSVYRIPAKAVLAEKGQIVYIPSK